MATFDSTNRALNDACDLALKKSTNGYYHDLMAEAVFRNCLINVHFVGNNKTNHRVDRQ